MKTISQLYRKLAEKFNTQLVFSFPTLYLIVVDDFSNIDEEHRTEELLSKCAIKAEELDTLLNSNIISLLALTNSELTTEYSYLFERSSNTHWLSKYTPQFRENIHTSATPTVIHFYGQKGGQARSSVLGALARDLADQGHKILIIDADIEAPTLHTILGIETLKIENTLMGCIPANGHIAYTSNPTIPGVFFLGCRPTDNEWDMDYQAFSLRCSLDPAFLSEIFDKILSQISPLTNTFDTILIDHRTGATTSVIPIISSAPGPCVIFTRPDNQTTWFQGIETLLSFYPKNPGAFISFSLDNLKKVGAVTEAESALKERLLELMSDALTYDAEDKEPLPVDELERYYINWTYDRAFFNSSLPKISQLQSENAYALNQLKEILGIQKPKESPDAPYDLPRQKTSSSGIMDETWFVESEMTRAILQPDSNLNYIFGRKGTGKSRLFKESIERDIGLPLLAPSEFGQTSSNIPHSSEPSIKSLLTKFGENYEGFWWSLLAARLEADRSNEAYSSTLKNYADLPLDELTRRTSPAACISKLKARKITLLVDGLETAVSSTKLKRLVEGLLLCMNTVQNSLEFRLKLNIRLFLRVDLAIGAQNIEQQTAGRKIDLYWDEQAQMNYALACLVSNEWIRTNFEDTVRNIDKKKQDICLGRLATDACEELLLQIFPENLRRSNIKTITFIKTYFRDASSQNNEHLATFYPRLFLGFVSALEKNISKFSSPIDSETKKVNQALIFEAYESAAKEFINDAQQELIHAITLDDDLDENSRKIRILIDALKAKATPFRLEDLAHKVSSEVGSDISEDSVKKALRTMKEMGFFEQTAKDATRWRAGRVYKSALKMKYVR